MKISDLIGFDNEEGDWVYFANLELEIEWPDLYKRVRLSDLKKDIIEDIKEMEKDIYNDYTGILCYLKEKYEIKGIDENYFEE